MNQQIRILLVDDHSLFRESLSRLLEAEPDFRIAGTAATVEAAFGILAREPADIVLLDFDLGEEQGSLFLTRARERAFAGRVLMVTAGLSDAGTLRAFEQGAAGVFLKHSPPGQLIEAIRRVAGGEMWLDSRAVPSLVAAAARRNSEPDSTLNSRERSVLKAVFEGLTNKEIGGRLQISESSVKAVLQQLFEKTGVRTRSQLVRIALEKHSRDWIG